MAYYAPNNHQQSQNHSPNHRLWGAIKTYGPDRVGIVSFCGEARMLAPPMEVHDARLLERIISLPSQVGNWTNLTAGLRVATTMASQAPAGCLKRIWLLTDGVPNREVEHLWAAVASARNQRININTIGFGDPGSSHYDPELLKRIAGATHNGRFVPVDSLRSLSNALKANSGQNGRCHRQEYTVMAIDCSPSMLDPMEGKRRIDVVVEAMTHLLHYKQKCFA